MPHQIKPSSTRAYLQKCVFSVSLYFCSLHPLRGLLVRDDLKAIVTLIKGQHDGHPINKRLVLHGDGGTALVGPDRAYAGPDFLSGPVFASGLAVIDNVSRFVRHILLV